MYQSRLEGPTARFIHEADEARGWSSKRGLTALTEKKVDPDLILPDVGERHQVFLLLNRHVSKSTLLSRIIQPLVEW